MSGNDRDADEVARREREDAAWRSIVDNYGDQPELDATELGVQDEPDAAGPEVAGPEIAGPDEPGPPARLFAYETPAELGPRSWEPTAEDDRYVPPPPPPVPRPHGLRLVAWIGLFGVPTVVLLCIVLHVSLPSPLGFLALVWFVGGFGYLVATMGGSGDSDGGWDDGAVV